MDEKLTRSAPGGAPSSFDSRGRRAARHSIGPTLAVALGLVVTATTFCIARGWERGLLHRRFAKEAGEHVAELSRNLEHEFRILSSLRAFFNATESVSAQEFRAFVGDCLAKNDGLIALEWLERVPAVARADFESRQSSLADGPRLITEPGPSGTPVCAARRDEYFPVTFVEPLEDAPWNQRALGFDHSAILERRIALHQACNAGGMVALGPITLTPLLPDAANLASAPLSAILFYLPTYAGGGVPTGAADRDLKLRGYACAIFAVDRLFASVLGRVRTEAVALDLFVAPPDLADEAVSAVEPTRLFTHPSRPPADLREFRELAADLDLFEAHWRVGERNFTAFCSPAHAGATLRWCWTVLLIGTVCTGWLTRRVARASSERHQIERELRQFWRLAGEMLCVLGSDGRLRRVNPAWTRLLGLREDELLERPLVDVVHPDDQAALGSSFAELAASGRTLTFEVRVRTSSGTWRRIEFTAAGAEDGHAFHAVASDVTEARLTLEEMERRATLDPMTGALTRRALFETLAREIERAHRYGSPLSIALLDLDHFKDVNDTFGHAVGDLLLKRLGKVLSSHLRGCDALGRYGGDEFIVVMPETDLAQARQTAARLLRVLERDGTVTTAFGDHVPLRGSIGVAVLTREIQRAEEFVNCADAALYRAKEAGRNKVA